MTENETPAEEVQHNCHVCGILVVGDVPDIDGQSYCDEHTPEMTDADPELAEEQVEAAEEETPAAEEVVEAAEEVVEEEAPEAKPKWYESRRKKKA